MYDNTADPAAVEMVVQRHCAAVEAGSMLTLVDVVAAGNMLGISSVMIEVPGQASETELRGVWGSVGRPSACPTLHLAHLPADFKACSTADPSLLVDLNHWVVVKWSAEDPLGATAPVRPEKSKRLPGDTELPRKRRVSRPGPEPELLVEQGKLVLGEQMWRLGRNTQDSEVAVVVERDGATNKVLFRTPGSRNYYSRFGAMGKQAWNAKVAAARAEREALPAGADCEALPAGADCEALPAGGDCEALPAGGDCEALPRWAKRKHRAAFSPHEVYLPVPEGAFTKYMRVTDL
eukprot:gene5895-6136_t